MTTTDNLMQIRTKLHELDQILYSSIKVAQEIITLVNEEYGLNEMHEDAKYQMKVKSLYDSMKELVDEVHNAKNK